MSLISSNIKNITPEIMKILELFDQYESICQRIFSDCTAKIMKNIKTNIIKLLISMHNSAV